MRTSRFHRAALALVLALSIAGCTSAFRRAMDQGDAFAKAGRWDDAVTAYEEAVRLDPEDEDAKKKLAEARSGAAADRVKEGQALMAAGDPVGAMRPFHEAMGLDPKSAPAKQGYAEARAATLAKAEQALAAEDPKQAVRLARAVLELDPNDSDARGLEARGSEKAAAMALARADAHVAAGEATHALVDVGEALLYTPNDSAARSRRDSLRTALRKELTYHVLLGNFDGDASADDLGADVNAASLTRGFDPALPLRISDKAPAEAKDPKLRLQGMRLGGQFRSYRYDRQSTTSRRSCQYVCGTDMVPNPDYPRAESDMRSAQQAAASADSAAQSLSAQIPSLERARDTARSALQGRERVLSQAESALSSCRSAGGGPGSCSAEERRRDAARTDVDVARDDLRRAEDSLSSGRRDADNARSDAQRARSEADSARARFDGTPPKVAVDRYCTHTYPVETVSVKGDVEVVLRGESLYGTETVLAQSVSGHFDRSDESFRAERNVCPELAAGDPLVIPSAADVKRFVVASAIVATQAEILRSFERYRALHAERAKQAEVDAKPAVAADEWARWVLVGVGKGNEMPTALARIAQHAGVEPRAVELALVQD
jgi:tetratricopeptide (TPR) repeat protein